MYMHAAILYSNERWSSVHVSVIQTMPKDTNVLPAELKESNKALCEF